MSERLLLIDTCDEASVALVEEGRVLRTGELPGRRASEQLLPLVRAVLAEQGWELSELSAIGVVRGPGSFTGVRVGLSVAKGLSEGAGVPLVAVSRLEVLARAGEAPEAMAVLRAGREESFFRQGAEEGLERTDVLRSRALEGGVEVVCEESAAEEFTGVALRTVAALRAETALLVVMERVRKGLWDDAMLLDALYLRRTEQELLERQRAHRARRQEQATGGGASA